MAIVTVVATGDMSWVFACRRDAVMTRTTRAQYLRVVDSERGHPDIRVVAIFADIR